MFFGPIFEDEFEIGAYSCGFLKKFFDVVLLVEEKLDGVGGDHEVENEISVLGLIVGDADDISDLVWVLCDKFVFDVPAGLADHVGEEDGFYFVEQEDFSDGFEYFVDGVAEGDVAVPGDGPEYGYNPAQLAFAVGVEGLAVAWGHIGLIFLFVHKAININTVI